MSSPAAAARRALPGRRARGIRALDIHDQPTDTTTTAITSACPNIIVAAFSEW